MLRKILLIIFVVVLVGCVFVGLMGYNLYNSAVSRISLRDKVEEVRGDENFVGFSDLPDDLVNATIAVEDHRFREHGSIDLISIGRAMSANIKAKDAVEGGSTITQQVAKNLYFMTEKENLVNMVWRVDENIITVSGIDVSKKEIIKVARSVKKVK